ncbi:MAG: hypothetical protein RI897_2223 [Verrucomicrobiota bacterium]|jgi:hypothetical protein
MFLPYTAIIGGGDRGHGGVIFDFAGTLPGLGLADKRVVAGPPPRVRVSS